MGEKIGNLIFIFVVGAFGIYYFFDVQGLPNLQERLIIQILFWGLMILLVIEASRTIYKIRKEQEDQNEENQNRASINELLKKWLINKPVMLMAGIGSYIYLFPKVGYFITSLVFLALFNYLLGSRKIWELTFLPASVLIFIYFIFVFLLDIRLPSGILI